MLLAKCQLYHNILTTRQISNTISLVATMVKYLLVIEAGADPFL